MAWARANGLGFRELRSLGLSVDEALPLLDSGRREIQITSGSDHDNATAAAGALLAAGAEIFMRGGMLVHPMRLTGGQTTLTGVTPTWLQDQLPKHVVFTRKQVRGGKIVRENPPAAVAQAIIDRGADNGFPTITGLLTAPTVRSDLSLLSAAGYDPQSGYYLTNTVAGVSVPDTPTKCQADDVLALLLGALAGFPFADGASEAVAVAAILHTCARPLMPVVPLVAITAPVAGTGKSYLTQVIAAPAYGRALAVLGATERADEAEKMLISAAMAGTSIINLDNRSRMLRSDTLAQMIEQERVQLRIMGRSKVVTIDNVFCFFVNGNNLAITGDLPRRTLTIRLDARSARPELRQFAANPLTTVVNNRAAYLSAALTIVKYGAEQRAQMGSPAASAPPLASFQRWSELIREPLIALGMADPCITQDAADDPEIDDLRAVFVLWHAQHGDKLMTVAEIIQSYGYYPQELRDAFLMVASDPRYPGTLSGARLGYFLRGNKDRIVHGLRLESIKSTSNTRGTGWRIVTCPSAPSNNARSAPRAKRCLAEQSRRG